MQKNRKQVSEKSEFELLCLYMNAVAQDNCTEADYFFRYYCQIVLSNLRAAVAQHFYSHRRYSDDLTQEIIMLLITRINQRPRFSKGILLAIQGIKKQPFSNAFHERRINDWTSKVEKWLDEAMIFVHQYSDVNSPQLDEEAKRINNSVQLLLQEINQLITLDLTNETVTKLTFIKNNLGKVRIPSSALLFDSKTIKNKIIDFRRKKSNENEILGVEHDAGSNDNNSFIEPTTPEEHDRIGWAESYNKNQNSGASESDFSNKENELHQLNTKDENPYFIDALEKKYDSASNWLDKHTELKQERKKMNNCLKVPVFEAEETLNKAKERYSVKNNKTNASMLQKSCDKLRKERVKYIIRIRILKSLKKKYEKKLDGETITDEQVTKDLNLKNRQQLIAEKKKIKELLSICPGMDVILESYHISGKA